MVQKWQQAGLPAGVLNLVQGGREVGQTLSTHPQVDGLFFTGSSAAGKALHRAFADHPQKILALEMGGNNPLIVSEVDNVRAAAYLTILSAYFSSGQRCSCARRLILIDNEESDLFLGELVEMISGVSFGFYDDQPQPFMGTVISQEMGRRLLQAQAEIIQQQGQPLVKMQSHRDCDALVSPGLIDVTEVANRSDEELFGPLLHVVRVKDFEAAITEANDTAYGLSAGLLSSNRELYEEFIHRIRAGVVNWNRQTTGASGKLPFGGCGLSGNHRPSAYFAADYCSFPTASLESDQLVLPEQPLTGIRY
jgi:succinylglutamic semialdehyde dehydrogenase